MKNETTLKIEEKIQTARRKTLDILELAYGNTPEWKKVRSHILKIFGRDGLEQIPNIYSNGEQHERSNFF